VTEVFTFDRWEREIGADDAEALGRDMPNGAFTALNMMRYRTGLFGPRPGIKTITVTSMTAGDAVWFDAATAHQTFYWGLQGGTAVKSALAQGSAETALGAVGGNQTRAASQPDRISGRILLTNDGDGVYEISAAVTALDTTYGDDGYTVAAYRDRVYSPDGTNQYEVYYSAAGDSTTWAATQFFAVGEDGTIYNLSVIADSLYIQKEQALYILDGSPISGRLRRLGDFKLERAGFIRTNGHVGYGANEVSGDPIMIRDRRARRIAPWMRDYFPSTNNRSLRYDVNDRGTVFGTLANENTNDDTGILSYEGLWTVHTFGVDINFSAMANVDVVGTAYPESEDVAVIVNNDGSDPAFYTFNPSLDRPGNTGDNWATVGDASTTPESATWSTGILDLGDGARFIVRKVRVWFQKWDTGSGTAEGFTLGVDAIGDPNASSYTSSSTTQAFSEAATDGNDVQEYLFGEQGYGTACQLNFTGVHGVAFRKIKVYYDVERDEP